MINNEHARFNMVHNQLLPNGIVNKPLIDAMSNIPRELFVPPVFKDTAYLDANIAMNNQHFLLEPVTFAKLAQMAQIQPSDTVLDIGCGSGYSSAVFAATAQKVFALEVDELLASSAHSTLNKLNLRNIILISEPYSAGHKEGAPYNVIFINGLIDSVSPPLFDQLADKGRLVAFIRKNNKLGEATCFQRDKDVIITTRTFELGLPKLIRPPKSNAA